jgi:DNA recombination protein RmuC
MFVRGPLCTLVVAIASSIGIPTNRFDTVVTADYAPPMTPAAYAATAIAAVAIVVALIAIIVASRRREGSPDVPALIQQIDSVRSELRDLSDLFLVPRTRGAVGETILSELLASWLPPGAFELQYGFPNGARVDAVVRLGSRLVPVDSKFPLEAVRRHGRTDARAEAPLPADLRKALRRHVTDIAERYISPADGTMSFALMYIPSERVYVDLFASGVEEPMRIALEHNVVPVSPATLFLYVQTVAYGLRGLAIPRETQRLIDSLAALRSDLSAFSKSFELAGTHLRNLGRAFDEAGAKLNRVELRADRLHEGRTDE